MSSSEADGGDRPSREVAYRLFADEFDDASMSYSESDEERAPNYVVTPTGARVNRLFAVGVLTEVEAVNDDVLRARIVDPTGAFVSYAGQYQPDEMAFLDRASPPAFVALSGKARTFQPDDSDRVFTSVRPESVSQVDANTRDRWTVSTAEATLERIGVMAAAIQSGVTGDALRTALLSEGVDESLATGVPLALDHYGTTPGYLAALRRVAVDALEVVADERDSVRSLDIGPADVGERDTALAALAADFDLESHSAVATAGEAMESGERAEAAETTEAAETKAATESADTTAADTAEAVAGASSEADAGTGIESAAADSDSTTADDIESEPADTEEVPTFDDASAQAAGASESVETGGSATGDAAEDSTADSADEPTDSEPAGTPTSAAPASDESEPAPTTDTATPETSTGELGDFETGSGASTETTDDGETDDGETDADGMYELDEAEREEVEAEFGTEFSTGSEVAPAGEADIDVPSVEELEDELDEDLGATAEDTDAAAEESAEQGAEESADEPADEASADAAEDIDLEAAVVDAMAALDDGDGATREGVVAAVIDDYEVDPDDVEDAIQSALMSGQCYEPTEDSLKAI